MQSYTHPKLKDLLNLDTIPKYFREMLDSDFKYTIQESQRGPLYFSYRTNTAGAKMGGLSTMALWLNLELGYINKEEAQVLLLPMDMGNGGLIPIYKDIKEIDDLLESARKKMKIFSFYHNEDLSALKDNSNYRSEYDKTKYKCSGPIDIRPDKYDNEISLKPNTKLILDLDGEERIVTYHRPGFSDFYHNSRYKPTQNPDNLVYTTNVFFPLVSSLPYSITDESLSYFFNRLNVPPPRHYPNTSTGAYLNQDNLKKRIPWYIVTKTYNGISLYPTAYNYFFVPDITKKEEGNVEDLKNPPRDKISLLHIRSLEISDLDRIPRITSESGDHIPTSGSVKIQFDNQLDEEGRIKWNSFTPPNNRFDNAFFARVLATGTPTALRFEGKIDIANNACYNNRTITQIQFGHNYIGSIGNNAFHTGLSASNGVITTIPTIIPTGVTSIASNAFYGRKIKNLIIVNSKIANNFTLSGVELNLDKNPPIPDMGTLSDEEKIYYYFFINQYKYSPIIDLTPSSDPGSNYITFSPFNPYRKPCINLPVDRFNNLYYKLKESIDKTHTSGIALLNSINVYLAPYSSLDELRNYGTKLRSLDNTRTTDLTDNERKWFESLGRHLLEFSTSFTYDKILSFCYNLRNFFERDADPGDDYVNANRPELAFYTYGKSVVIDGKNVFICPIIGYIHCN